MRAGGQVLLHGMIAGLGGLAYMGVELLWRGSTHWTMGVLGGVCFALIGLLDEWQDHPSMLLQMVQGAALITTLELLTGLIVNRWLGMQIWDYSDMPGNLWGQVCPQFIVAWLALAWLAVHAENRMHGVLKKMFLRLGEKQKT